MALLQVDGPGLAIQSPELGAGRWAPTARLHADTCVWASTGILLSFPRMDSGRPWRAPPCSEEGGHGLGSSVHFPVGPLHLMQGSAVTRPSCAPSCLHEERAGWGCLLGLGIAPGARRQARGQCPALLSERHILCRNDPSLLSLHLLQEAIPEPSG